MKPEYYVEFKILKESGFRAEAKASLDKFLESFRTEEEKENWVRWFLENEKTGHKIRHEIYEQLVFPVLLAGYRNLDAWSTFQLAETSQNVYAVPSMHAAIDHKSERGLLREAFALETNEALRKRLLAIEIYWFEYYQHEWPWGILFGSDGATIEGCETILNQVSYAKSLDTQHDHVVFFLDFEAKVAEYKARLIEHPLGKQK